MSVLSAPHFHNEKAAYAYVEARVWPEGPVCPHCGGFERISLMGGKSTRIGAYKCYQCRKPFTVKVGTIFEASHVPLRFWLQAMFLMASSKKGISSNQLHRTLGVTLKTAWFMSHRIREAMRDGELAPFGHGGGTVEADETFIGTDPDEPKAKRGGNHKMKVLSLIDRETGRAKSTVLDFISAKAIGEIVVANLSKEAILMTDEARHYVKLGKGFAGHGHTNHGAGEYVSRFNPQVHTNTVEGFFSIFKRGMRGVYQHCGKRHLHRYLAEFDFRYSNRGALGIGDVPRADTLLAGVVGKRLTYRTARGQA
ncbi:IS1595 family transposase [Phenylobacterium sp.]|jgi:transposase-like protein|uniref:IS1595 family transposase n=1 Tax=Phenylobacterium sp. TaxID=1871053 RepID=UPI002F41C8D1